MKIPGQRAYENAAKGENARWGDDAGRLLSAPLRIALTPKFKLSARDKFFCIGSCFARNIEEALLYRDVDVLSKRVIATIEESPLRPNGLINKFTTASIVNEVRWALGGGQGGEAYLLDAGEDRVLDLQLAPHVGHASRERGLERRRYFEKDYFVRIAQSDVIIVTLGLIETWRDERHVVWQNMAPPFALTRREPERFSLYVTDVAQNIEALEEMRALIRAKRPDMKFVVTVSPVPLDTTFTGQDVVVANTLSKSVLRAAAAAFADAHDDVDYYPSYEMIVGAPRADTFAADGVHIRNSVVQDVVGAFVDLYLPGLPAPLTGFIELYYLQANPDVAEAVRRGALRSGFDHWRASGKAEGRPLAPPDVADLQAMGFE